MYEKGECGTRFDILCDKGEFMTKSDIQFVERMNIEPNLALCVSMLRLHLIMLSCDKK